MIRIELTETEAAVLTEILVSYLSDLRGEIVRTEKKEWRSDMKDRENMVKEIIQRLRTK